MTIPPAYAIRAALRRAGLPWGAGRSRRATPHRLSSRGPSGGFRPIVGEAHRHVVLGSRIGGTVVAAIGLIGLVGWVTGSRALTAVRAEYIPIAPNTALLFVLLGASLCTLGSRWRLASLFATGAMAVSLLVSGLRLAEYITGVDVAVDHWIFRFPSENLGLAPVGKMAFFTALTFVLACIALVPLVADRWSNGRQDLVRLLGLLVTLTGLVFALGYVYESPLLYGGRSIPMALPTAVGFLLLGLSITVPAIARDRAARHAAQRALRMAHDELESRVAERTAQLHAANEDLQHTVIELEERTMEAERAEVELRRSEEQLRQAQKMEAIGQLAGGVAHDFNNMLTAIKAYADLILSDDQLGDDKRADLNEIRMAADRAAALTRQLLAFSRKQVLQLRVTDLNSIVSDLEGMLRRLMVGDVELSTVLAADLWLAKVDPGQIEQVLMNLVVNARDAMPDGGTIKIQTSNIELDEVYCQAHPTAQPGPHVVLSVSDTGCGMDELTQRRVFEPFFTTKERGHGTGLGLSTAYGIVKQSGGHIWLYSEVGQGTVFKIYFPAVDDSAEPFVPAETPASTSPGWETVLLVDDEESIRRPVRKMLERNGYTVLEASSGAEALRICDEHTEPIQLVITDMMMPGMHGRELFERLSSAVPHSRVLFTSGYADEQIIQRGLLDPRMAFLQKPFTLSALVAKVREVLLQPPVR